MMWMASECISPSRRFSWGKKMNANEILQELRARELREPGKMVMLQNVEFDQGSLEDQLWEEFAMLPTAIEDGNGEAAWVS